jgi:catechol O-methyltransferase
VEGREIALLEYVYGLSNIDELRGNPAAILAAIEERAKTVHFMHIGQDKGKYIKDIINEKKPSIMVEFGGYCGYSAVMFGDAVRKAGAGKQVKYYSLEFSPLFAAIGRSMVDLAGLSDIVKVVVGPASHSLERLHKGGVLKEIDVLFIDHEKSLYVSDLKTAESLSLLPIGAVIAADNILKPGAPQYVEYVRNKPYYESSWIEVTNSRGHTVS